MEVEQSPYPPVDSREVFANRILRYRDILFRFWWVLLLTIALGLGYQAYKLKDRTEVYVSNARLIVEGQLALPDRPVLTEDSMNFFGTQEQLMQSEDIRRRATERTQKEHPNLVPCSVSIGVGHNPRTSIFELNAMGDKPEYVRAYLDSLLAEYIATRKEMYTGRSLSALTAIRAENKKVSEELELSQAELLTWQEQNNHLMLQSASNEAAKYLATLNAKLAILLSEKRLKTQLTLEENLMQSANLAAPNANAQYIREIPDAPSNDPEQAPLPMEGDRDTAFLEAKEQLLMMKANLEQMLVVRKPGHYKVVQLKNQIAQQEKLLTILKQQSEDRLAAQKQLLDSQILAVRGDIADWQLKSQEAAKKLVEYDRLNGKVERLKALNNELSTTTQSLSMGTNLQQDEVSVLEHASPAYVQTTSVRRALLIGGAIGLLAGLGILFLVGMVDDRVLTVVDLQPALRESVISIIPEISADQSPILQPLERRERLMEAFRNIRSWFVFTPWEGKSPKTVVIASAIPGEGKSTMALNFALSLASGGARTLLIDADLRRGRVSELLETPPEPGLSDVLLRHVHFNQAVHATKTENLFLVPRGSTKGRSAEVLFGSQLDEFIRDASGKFDYVIMDSSPVLAVDDVSMIAPKADLVIFVMRCGISRQRLSLKALNILEARQVSIGGLVLNGAGHSILERPHYTYDYHSPQINTVT